MITYIDNEKIYYGLVIDHNPHCTCVRDDYLSSEAFLYHIFVYANAKQCDILGNKILIASFTYILYIFYYYI